MNLLVTGAWEQAQDHIPLIRSLGHEVIFLQHEKDPLPCAADWVEGVIGNGLFLYHPFENFTHLRYVQLTSAGFDRIPLDQMREHGVLIHNAKNVYSIPMAEHAVAGVLYLYRQMDFFRENQKQREWKKNRDLRELFGKMILIIGCGSVGCACAQRFHAFGCSIHGITHNHPQSPFFDAVHPLDELDKWLEQTDVLIISTALSEETRGLLDERRLKLLKDDAILINLSRGSIVDEKALQFCIPTLGGAVLDVFTKEPLSPESQLWEQPNVIISPHNSFIGDGTGHRLSAVIMENLGNLIDIHGVENDQ